MPTDTFFRLSNEKQARILKAAQLEFSTVSLKEASVANIIKKAEIPRGSFYQYFEGMSDLYFYFFDTIRRSNRQTFSELLVKNQGDLFASYQCFFEEFVRETLTGEYALFYRQMFLNMGDPMVKHFSKNMHISQNKDFHEGMRKLELSDINHEQLTIQSDDDLRSLVHLIMHMMISTLVLGLRQEQEDKARVETETIQNFNKQLNWLKYGVLKKEVANGDKNN